MEEALAELEGVQTQLLQRISKLEHSLLPSSPSPNDTVDDTDTVGRLSSILRNNGVHDFSFKRVSSDYYDWPLEARRDALSAASVHHLCKSIVLVNTQAPANVVGCTDPKNSKYYVVVVQYTARFNAEACQEFSVFAQQRKYREKEIQHEASS
ncbi:hypothetical protein E2542_SST19851 [Spatholobus suberectus]|nr:hypothetical protein E2542_SST19851 [Spatholobus suberectus]